MDLRGKTAALYGRFSTGARERFADEIARRDGFVARDLTRRSDVLVIGALASPLIDGGHLAARLTSARKRKMPVYAERRFAEALTSAAEKADGGGVPLSAVAAARALSKEQIDVLAAFDIVRADADHCRFADAEALKAAADLLAAGRSLGETVRVLTKARDLAPRGRRKIILDSEGRAALQWDEGLTTIEGQGCLPLDAAAASVDDLFEAAAIAEADGDGREAERCYELASRTDRKDAIACFNLGVVRLADDPGAAALAFRQALARDPDFVEARYNLAAASEALGKFDLAREQLVEALRIDPDYADARFNLAQLELKRGALAEAKMHFERYLASDPPAEWAIKARRAIQYCAAAISA
jgi:tetratricopeptide (TPR) repeat protein